jgi:hypothetical protein
MRQIMGLVYAVGNYVLLLTCRVIIVAETRFFDDLELIPPILHKACHARRSGHPGSARMLLSRRRPHSGRAVREDTAWRLNSNTVAGNKLGRLLHWSQQRLLWRLPPPPQQRHQGQHKPHRSKHRG